MASEYDTGRIYQTHANPEMAREGGELGGGVVLENYEMLTRLKAFLRNFRNTKNQYIYLTQLLQQYRRGEYCLEVEMTHLGSYDEVLLENLQNSPNEKLVLFEQAAREVLAQAIMAGKVPNADGEDGAGGRDDNDDDDDDDDEDDDRRDGYLGDDTNDSEERNRRRRERRERRVRAVADLNQLEVSNRHNKKLQEAPAVQIILKSNDTPTDMRSVSSTDINKLVIMPGIVVSASRAKAKATKLMLFCKACESHREIVLELGLSGKPVPNRCWNSACRESGNSKNEVPVILPDQCSYTDYQQLKLQELPEVVPTGEMPRSIMCWVDRYLVDKVTPGTRVAVVGVSSVVVNSVQRGRRPEKVSESLTNVKTPFLRVVGMRVIADASGRTSERFAREQEEACLDLSRRPDIYELLCRSIAPSISGSYTEDIKRAIACLLFGGTRRKLPDGVRLRGDINVLLLGDPSTAKSQFLKFVEKVAPVGVYTSGKGSSAAGLTASVIKDSHGEFYLEGGAMVLADGGVVCIDEFDKMRETDRVAIHEAMEQQTISVAKAGITTILNSRASVLAAANPVFGTYDDMKSAAENIDFLPTILSRFDMIFIVRDVKDEVKDREIARHVLSIHVGSSGAGDRRRKSGGGGTSGGGAGGGVGGIFSSEHLMEFEVDDGLRGEGAVGSRASGEATGGNVASSDVLDLVTLKRYIAYCRSTCAPTLTSSAAEMLRNHYVGIREDHRQRNNGAAAADASTIPITTRQLEAIVRISEALAKMRLAREVTIDHVTEAIRLFKVSTLNAANTGVLQGDLSSLSGDQAKEIRRVEEQIQRRIPIGTVVSTMKLLEDFVGRQGYSSYAVHKAIQIMVNNRELMHLNQRKVLKRLK